MKTICLFTFAFFCLFSAQIAYSQTYEVPKNYAFKKAEDYKQYESSVIDAANWLENTPLDQEIDKRKDVSTFLVAWVSGSPSVSIELQEDIVGFMGKNPDLFVIYMGAYTRFMLEHRGSEDKLQANILALQSVMKVYKEGKGIKKDKVIENFIKMESKGELSKWVASKVGITDRLNRDVEMYNGTKSPEAEGFYNEGLTYTKNNDFKKAIEAYRKAIVEDRRYVEAYDNIAVAFRRLNMLDSAEYYYLQSIKLYPKGAMAHQNLGLVYQVREDYEKALEQYQILQELKPEGAEGIFGVAQVYLNMKEYEKAVEAGLKAEQIYLKNKDPWAADAQVLIGLAYFGMGKKGKAQTYLKKAMEGGVKLTPEQQKYYGVD
jgi:tetratricopeptide (TPR) repeat protein